MAVMVLRDETTGKYYKWGEFSFGEIPHPVAVAINYGKNGVGSVVVSTDTINKLRDLALVNATEFANRIPLTVQGASEQYIQDRCDNLYTVLGRLINTSTGNVLIDGRTNRDQILNAIAAK